MPEKKTDTDVIIVGAGPAGLSAAVWCAEIGLKTLVFEKETETGGQLLRIYNPVTNYIGIETADGREMRDRFLDTFAKRGQSAWLSGEVVEIDPASKSVVTVIGDRLSAHALIIATGVRRRRLNVPGEEFFKNKGIIESGSNDKEKAKGKSVLIVGGGDAALENALILAEFASKVCVVYRGSKLRARAEFTEKALNNPKIEFRFETAVTSIKGGDQVESVEITNSSEERTKELGTDLVLIRIGVQPNTDFLHGKIALDSNGFILINQLCETSAARIYAVGDAANPIAPTIAAAAGMAAIAAKAIFNSQAYAKVV